MANNILRGIVSRLTSNYSFVVIDNEAGMEHLSRRTEEEVDHLFIISDPAPRSLRTIGRIAELVDEMADRVHNSHVVLSRVKGSLEDLSESTQKEIEGLSSPVEAIIPYDDLLVDLDLQGEPLLKIPAEAVSYQAVKKMLQDLKILN